MNKTIQSKLILVFIAFLASSFSIIGIYTEGWKKIDKTHSVIRFEATHLGVPVEGRFKDYDYTLNFDPENLSSSMVDITLKVKSLDSDDDHRDKHLLTTDFFNAKKHPTIQFKSSSFTKIDDKNYTIAGKLTMRGVNKDLNLNLNVLVERDHIMKPSMQVMGVKITSTIYRGDFGVGTGNWAKDAVIGDDVELTAIFELQRKK